MDAVPRSNWLAFDLTGNSFAVGIVSFASLSPYLLSPLGGLLADRFDRRRVVAATRVASAGIALALALLAFTDLASVWNIAVLAFLGGVARAIETPAEQALLPNTVDTRHILNAVTLYNASYQGSRVVGPLAGAPLLAAIGAGGVFAMAAVFYAFSVLLLMRVHVHSSGDVQSVAALAGETRRAAGYIGRTGPVLMVFGLVVLHCWLTMSFDSLLPEFATNALNGGELEYNALVVAVGAGSLVATLALSTVSRPALRGSLFLAAGLGSGLFPASMALTGTPASSAMAAVGIGASQAVFMALASTFLQSVVPDGIRGRVMSLYVMSAAGIMALMNLANGLMADEVGAPLLFALPGLGFAGILAAWSLLRSDLRRVYKTGALATAAS